MKYSNNCISKKWISLTIVLLRYHSRKSPEVPRDLIVPLKDVQFSARDGVINVLIV